MDLSGVGTVDDSMTADDAVEADLDQARLEAAKTADDIRTRLDEIEAYCSTPSPWDLDHLLTARTDLPAVVAALRDALAERDETRRLMAVDFDRARVAEDERDALTPDLTDQDEPGHGEPT
jgi:hypothetical protein